MNRQLNLFDLDPADTKKRSPRVVQQRILIAHIDGASRGNPGPAGAGVVIYEEQKKPLGKNAYLGTRTNNQAEYLALALALYHVRQMTDPVEPITLLIRSDSQLLVRQLLGAYKVKNPFIIAMMALIDELRIGIACRFEHVPREQNSDADAQANIAVDKKTALPAAFKQLLGRHELLS